MFLKRDLNFNLKYYKIILFVCLNVLFVNCLFSITEGELQLSKEAFNDGFYQVVEKKLEFLRYETNIKNKIIQEAMLVLAFSYYHLNKIKDSEMLLDRLIIEETLFIAKFDLLMLKINLLLKRNDYYLAEKTVILLWESDFLEQQKITSLNLLIENYFKNKQYKLAEHFLNDFLDNPVAVSSKSNIKLFLMEALLFQDKLEKAVVILREIESLSLNDSILEEKAELLEGRLYLGDKQYDAGIRQYLKLYEAVDISSSSKQEALFGVSLSFWNLGMVKEAGDSLEKYVKTYPLASNLGSANLLLSQSFLKMGDYSKALSILLELTEEFVDNDVYYKSLYWLGEVYYRTKDYDKADKIFNRLIGLKDKSALNYVYGHMGKAWILFDKSHFLEAYEFFIMIAEEKSNHSFVMEALIMAGNCQFLLDDYEKAKDIFNDFLKRYALSVKVPEVLHKLGIVFSKNGDYQNAIKTWDSVFENYPDNKISEESLWKAGKTLMEKGAFSDALIRFEHILKNYPDGDDYDAALLEIGNCYYNQGKYIEAKDAYENCLLNSKSILVKHRATYCLGWCFYLLRKERKALEVFELFLDKYPDSDLSPQVLFWLGEYEFDRKKFKKAMSYFELLKDKYHDSNLSDNSYFLAAKSAYNLDLFDKAISLLSLLIIGYTDSDLLADSYFLRGQSYLKLKKADEAMNDFIVFDAAFETSYLRDTAFEFLADIFAEKKQFKNAIIYYNKIVKNSEQKKIKSSLFFKLAESYKNNEEIDKAIETSLKLIYDDNSKEEVNKAIDFCIDLYLKRKDYDSAINLFMKLLNGNFDVNENIIKHKIRKLRYYQHEEKGE